MLKVINNDKKILEKLGYKKCKGSYGKAGLYYKCLSHGAKIIFLGYDLYVTDWNDTDPRIHTKPNCKYKYQNDFYDEIYMLIQAGIVKSRGGG